MAYGQGLLAADDKDGLGVTVPWGATHPWFAWTDGGDAGWDTTSGNGSGDEEEELGADIFFSTVAAEAPQDCYNSSSTEDEQQLRTGHYLRTVSKDLHWDSPPASPAGVAVHLPYSVVQMVVTALKADVVAVGAMQRGSGQCVLEHLLHVPREVEVPEVLETNASTFLHRRAQGAVELLVAGQGEELPEQLAGPLKCQPQALIAAEFDLDGYQGLVYGMWREAGAVPPAAEAIFRDAVASMPSLLSNRINAKKYENLGRRFDAILRMMPQAVVFVDDETMDVVVNPAAAELLELESHGEVEPGKVAQAMKRIAEASSGARTDPQRLMDAIAGNQGQDVLQIREEWTLTSPRRVLLVGSYPVSSHAAHGRLWFFEDVTTERDAQEAILTANKAKSQFLAMMSHELRTPMTGVLGMLDLLGLTNLTPQQREHVKMMQDSADGLMRVLNNILDYCKIEAGRLALEEIDFSVAEVMEQAVALQRDKLPDNHCVQLRLVEPTVAMKVAVRGDPVRLRQIVINLLNNAVKFTTQGSVILSWKFLDFLSSAAAPGPVVPACKVQAVLTRSGTAGRRTFRRSNSIHRSGSATNLQEQATGACGGVGGAAVDNNKKQLWLEVKIADTGVGMSADKLQSLFAGSHAISHRRDSTGAGLGLEICDGLLSLMGGAVRLESEQNVGTTVTFLLPLRPGEELEDLTTPSTDATTTAAPPKPPLKPTPTAGTTNDPSTETVRVLVAEDNRVNQMLIKKLFRHYGQDVELVGNGKLAVEAVQKNTYDLVLMDMQMPVLDGLSATKAIRAMQLPKCSVPIYALSADALAPESGPMEETGLTGYLSKPIVWDKMSVVLDKVKAQMRQS